VDPAEYLSSYIIEGIKISTIGDPLGGIVTTKHKDNVGLERSHGEIMVEYDIEKGQLSCSTTFIAFSGPYRWRHGHIEKFFV
jgi:hypothetical protein